MTYNLGPRSMGNLAGVEPRLLRVVQRAIQITAHPSAWWRCCRSWAQGARKIWWTAGQLARLEAKNDLYPRLATRHWR
jgi:hypothetical protein